MKGLELQAFRFRGNEAFNRRGGRGWDGLSDRLGHQRNCAAGASDKGGQMKFWEWLSNGNNFITFTCVGWLLKTWICDIIKAQRGKE